MTFIVGPSYDMPPWSFIHIFLCLVDHLEHSMWTLEQALEVFSLSTCLNWFNDESESATSMKMITMNSGIPASQRNFYTIWNAK